MKTQKTVFKRQVFPIPLSEWSVDSTCHMRGQLVSGNLDVILTLTGYLY